MRIALDAMGGDRAPDVTVQGALDAYRELGIETVLVGQQEVLRKRLEAAGGAPRMEIVDATEVIGMDEHPAAAVRRKKHSSIVVGVRLVKEGRADAFLSAGNSGAIMAAALLVLGRCRGVDRPCIGTPIPTLRGTTLLVDAGAITDPRPENLLEWARMGSIYMSALQQGAAVTVGLLSNGEEETKGNALTLEAHALLKTSGFSFHGNVEGRDILRGTVDVVVTDGFTGNVALKTIEGTAETLRRIIREEVTRGVVSKAAALVLRPAFARVGKRLDYAEVGGAPLLGVNGTVFISHGRSNANAIKNALRVAREAAQHDVAGAISTAAPPQED
ncbi:MAG: phosphate acyltransferase PlsX [Chloroflexota bacterium]|nr:phosphate acyltransferase PlsX [Chloroflexota bacterium]